MRWLEAVQGDFYYQDVLDLLKSPYLFAENPLLRKQALTSLTTGASPRRGRAFAGFHCRCRTGNTRTDPTACALAAGGTGYAEQGGAAI